MNNFEWTKEDSFRARMNGWDVFAMNGDPDWLVIQRLDEDPKFESDEQAEAFVEEYASRGNLLYRKAWEITR